MNAEYLSALVRGVLLAAFVGASTFLTTWATTDDEKTLIITTGTAVLGALAARFGIEGTIDSRRAKQLPAPEPVIGVSTPAPPPPPRDGPYFH